MKPSQKLFKFPVIMYDAISLKRAIRKEQEQEESEDTKDPLLRQLLGEEDPEERDAFCDVEYVIGHMCLPLTYIIGWADTYKRGTPLSEVKTKGFDATEIYVKDDNPITCPLNRQEFEELYDQFCSSLS